MGNRGCKTPSCHDHREVGGWHLPLFFLCAFRAPHPPRSEHNSLLPDYGDVALTLWRGCCPMWWGLLSDGVRVLPDGVRVLPDVEAVAFCNSCYPCYPCKKDRKNERHKQLLLSDQPAATLKCSRPTRISLKPPTVFTKNYSHNSHNSHNFHNSHNSHSSHSPPSKKNKKPDQSVGLLCLKVYSGRAISSGSKQSKKPDYHRHLW